MEGECTQCPSAILRLWLLKPPPVLAHSRWSINNLWLTESDEDESEQFVTGASRTWQCLRFSRGPRGSAPTPDLLTGHLFFAYEFGERLVVTSCFLSETWRSELRKWKTKSMSSCCSLSSWRYTILGQMKEIYGRLTSPDFVCAGVPVCVSVFTYVWLWGLERGPVVPLPLRERPCCHQSETCVVEAAVVLVPPFGCLSMAASAAALRIFCQDFACQTTQTICSHQQ